jgi:uncharacterized protein
MTEVLLIPGLWNSGPEHWQSYWERERPDCRRVEQSNWETPHRVDWVQALDRAILGAGGDVVLAAHSLGCATVAHWSATADASTRGKVRGALLVAPSDVEAPQYPEGTVGFRPMPLERLPFPTIVVASRDDIWVAFERAESFARSWGSRFVDAGARGHINSESGLGVWPEGLALLSSFIV